MITDTITMTLPTGITLEVATVRFNLTQVTKKLFILLILGSTRALNSGFLTILDLMYTLITQLMIRDGLMMIPARK